MSLRLKRQLYGIYQQSRLFRNALEDQLPYFA